MLVLKPPSAHTAAVHTFAAHRAQAAGFVPDGETLRYQRADAGLLWIARDVVARAAASIG